MPESYVNTPLAIHLKQEMTAKFGSVRNVSLLALVAFLTGLAGPFGTYETLSAPDRYLYWVLVVIGTAALGHGTGSAVEHVLHRLAWPNIPRLLAASVITALPVFGIIVLVLLSFGLQPDGEELLVLYAQCNAIVGSVTVLQFLATPARSRRESIKTPKLIGRLPHAKRGRLIRLAAQDHYVEVVTENGCTLISMRFRDAMAETTPEHGMQVHRSHWVAQHAIKRRSHKSDRLGLRMSDESFVPIGRKFRATVRQEGLL